jgi:signal peptidase I
MDVLSEYRAWKSRQRGLKEARLLLREARRVVRKYGNRLSAEAGLKVRVAIEALSEVVIVRDWDKLSGALNTLDKRLDEHLGFARKSTAREYVESIAIAVLIALFLRAFVVEAFKIPSGSMIPTLQVGDHIFVNKFIYGIRLPFAKDIKFWMNYRKPRRGEVIDFVYPKEPDKDFIKRIVAVEGDTVEVREDVVYINGKPVARQKIDSECRYEDLNDETSVSWNTRRCQGWRETVEGNSYTVIFDKNGDHHSSHAQVVPPQSVFVMGDNRDNSHDSRYWGFVPFDHIKGKAMVIWFSAGPTPEEGFPLFRFFRGLRYERLFHLVR